MPEQNDPFTVLVEQDEEGYFVATVPELPGCHTQARSLDALMRRVPRPSPFVWPTAHGDRGEASLACNKCGSPDGPPASAHGA